jgi:hypothetical protein
MRLCDLGEKGASMRESWVRRDGVWDVDGRGVRLDCDEVWISMWSALLLSAPAAALCDYRPRMETSSARCSSAPAHTRAVFVVKTRTETPLSDSNIAVYAYKLCSRGDGFVGGQGGPPSQGEEGEARDVEPAESFVQAWVRSLPARAASLLLSPSLRLFCMCVGVWVCRCGWRGRLVGGWVGAVVLMRPWDRMVPGVGLSG